MSEFTVLATAEEVAEAAAAEIADVLRGGAQTLVLAGGTTPKRCYELLAELDVQWGRVTVLFGDERCVPPDHPDSNYRMVKESLLDRVAPATVYRMPAELGPDEGADAYAEVVANVAPLDLVLLGVGEDGHVASLFPGHPLLRASGLTAGIRDSPKPPPERVTLTLEAIRDAGRVLIIATGAGKADAVALARRGETPSGMIAGARWLIDRAAARQ
ncbi:MAG: 6-phosphogluconolactonase [Chloroflexi bacterium]|nr:MAG: 6-phosphogluconolactonase [Chloroflexota bacterium]TMG63064.1 MAG: 6-phosphogluconolactonase [Chloroflexota bacterium]